MLIIRYQKENLDLIESQVDYNVGWKIRIENFGQ